MISSKLRLLQIELTKMLIDIDQLCKNNGINYFLDSGTLLGSVRHKGFIPWDDDIDIGMTRENYEKFLCVARKQLDSCYLLCDWVHDKEYSNPFAKVYKLGTKYVEKTGNEIEEHKGIFIDIFPYDNLPNDNHAIIKLQKNLTLLRRLIYCKSGVYKKRSFLLRCFASAVSLFLNRRLLISRYNLFAQKFNNAQTDYVYAHTGNAKLGSWIISRSAIESVSSVEFENQLFEAPCDWDLYLKEAYGDYMTLPPKEKQIAPHVIELEI